MLFLFINLFCLNHFFAISVHFRISLVTHILCTFRMLHSTFDPQILYFLLTIISPFSTTHLILYTHSNTQINTDCQKCDNLRSHFVPILLYFLLFNNIFRNPEINCLYIYERNNNLLSRVAIVSVYKLILFILVSSRYRFVSFRCSQDKC